MDRAKTRLSFIGVLIAALLVAFFGMLALVGLGNVADTAQADPLPHVHDDVTFEPWSSATSLPTEPGNWYLTTDVTIDATWSVPTGETILCLNGHGIKMTGNNSVVTVSTGAKLKLYDCDTTTVHKYSVSDAKSNGAGFATVNDALTSGYRTFIGGYITGGKGTPVSSWSRGGAFYIEGAVEMYGGTIIGNGQYDVTHGGGFNTQGSGTFKMYGGSIQNNAGKCGGATRLQGSGSCEIYGGKIINNIVSADGGGIHVGGSISLILKNCEISGNYAGNGPGAGIWMTTTGTEVSGKTVIENNLTNSSESNVEIGNGYVISVGKLTEGARIGVKLNNGGMGAFTSGWSTHMSGKDPADYFTSDNAAYSAFLSADEVQIGIPPHEHDGITFTAWTSNNSLPGSAGSYYLTADVTLSSTWTVPNGVTNLCLNGKGIKITGSGSVIIVDGSSVTLHLLDCDDDTVHYYTPSQTGIASLSNVVTEYSFKGGYVSGGIATEARGGGLRILNGANVVFGGGTLFGNKAGWGGGIFISDASLTIEDTAKIIGNYSSGAYTSGGGIFMEGNSTVTMTDGSIRYNSAQYSGGGVRDCITGDYYFTMTGGEITGNYSGSDQGNGFCFDQAMTFKIGGSAKITGNQGTNELFVTDGRTLTIVEPFTDDVSIGIKMQSGTGVFTSGWKDVMDDADPADYFKSDNAAYGIGLVNGEAAVLLPMTATEQGYEGVYDGAAHDITVTPSVEGVTIKYGTSANDCTLDALTYTDVGTYTVYYVVTKSGYVSAKGSATVTITKKALTVTAVAQTKTYGDADPELTYTSDKLVGTDAFSGALSRDAGETVGTYTITLGTLTAGGNYDISFTDGLFTITQKAETKVEVKTEEGSDEVGVSVGGLDKEVQAIQEAEPTAGEISVVMTVEPIAEPEIAEDPQEETPVQAIRKSETNKSFAFYEIKVEKKVDDVTTLLEETANVLEIAIPYAKAHKRGLTVCSYHGDAVLTFIESDNKEVGTFRVDKANKIIYIYTNTFSTYAIGYTPYYRVATAVDLGSYTGNVGVTLVNRADGTTYTQEDVDPANIVFADVPKGQYVLTVTWTDGAKNTISMPMAVGFTTVIPLPEEEPAAEPEAPAAAESEPIDDPFEETADDLEDVVLEDRRYARDIFALTKRDNDRDDA